MSFQYAMRDHYFPKDMRSPLIGEHDQMIALAALRFASLKVITTTK